MVVSCNKPLRLLNAFLEECDVKTIDNPQQGWNNYAERTKRRYIQQTRDVLVAVLKVVSPENAGYLWTAIQASKAVNEVLGVEGIMFPSQRLYLEAIAETYKNAGSWDTRRQILSIMTGVASLAAIREYIPVYRSTGTQCQTCMVYNTEWEHLCLSNICKQRGFG